MSQQATPTAALSDGTAGGPGAPSPVGTSSSSSLVLSLVRSGELHLRSSQRIQATAAERLRKLERASSKLLAAQRELTHQADAADSALGEIAAQISSCQAKELELAERFAQRRTELQAVLDGLARRPVAAALVSSIMTSPPGSPAPMLSSSGLLSQPALASSGQHPIPTPASPGPAASGGSSKMTLWDWVDSEAVSQLQANFESGLGEVKLASERARLELLEPRRAQMAHVRQLERALREAMCAGCETAAAAAAAAAIDASPGASPPAIDPSTTAAIVGSSVLAHANSSFLALESEVSSLNRIFAELCSSYDRIRQVDPKYAMAQQQLGSTPPTAVPPAGGDPSTAGTDALVAPELAHMQSLSLSMQHHSATILRLAGSIEQDSTAHAALHARTLEWFEAVGALTQSVKDAEVQWQPMHQHHASTATTLDRQTLQELHTLQLWYAAFEVGYLELLEEIGRRHRQLAHLQSFLAHVQAQLDDWYQAEVHQRVEFGQSFGRFLPPTLCPAIGEEVLRVRVEPEVLHTALPVYLPTEEEASARLERRRKMEQSAQVQSNQSPPSVVGPISTAALAPDASIATTQGSNQSNSSSVLTGDSVRTSPTLQGSAHGDGTAGTTADSHADIRFAHIKQTTHLHHHQRTEQEEQAEHDRLEQRMQQQMTISDHPYASQQHQANQDFQQQQQQSLPHSYAHPHPPQQHSHPYDDPDRAHTESPPPSVQNQQLAMHLDRLNQSQQQPQQHGDSYAHQPYQQQYHQPLSALHSDAPYATQHAQPSPQGYGAPHHQYAATVQAYDHMWQQQQQQQQQQPPQYHPFHPPPSTPLMYQQHPPHQYQQQQQHSYHPPQQQHQQQPPMYPATSYSHPPTHPIPYAQPQPLRSSTSSQSLAQPVAHRGSLSKATAPRGFSDDADDD